MIGRKSFLIVVTHYIADLLGFIAIIVLSKLWGGFAREAIGIIAFAMSFVSLFGIFTDFGFTYAHIKRVSEGKDLGICIGTFATIKILLTAFMVLSIFVSIYIWKNVFHGGFYDATTESVIIIIVFHSIFTNLQGIAIHTFTGRQEIAKLQTTRLFENIVKTPLTILVGLAGVSVMGVAISPAVTWPEFLQPVQKFLAEHATGSLAMTYVFGIMATFFVGMWLMRGYPIKRPSLSYAKNYFSYALPIAISSIISTIAFNIDKVMIGYYWTSANVGDYYIVQRILGFITVLYFSVGTILFPTISKQHAANDIEGAVKTVHLAERYISMVLIPPLIFIMIFSEPFINIFFDASFLPAAPVLVVMVIYAFFRGMNTPYSTLMAGINRPDITAKLGITICISNIVLNYLFIPKDGLLSNIQIAGFSFGITGTTGAALATAISFAIPFFILRIIAKRLMKMKIIHSHTPRHIIAGIVMGIALYFLAYKTTFFPVIRWYTLFGFSIIGLGVYIAVLFILKEFNKKDFNFFFSIIKPKEMLSYVKSELKGNKKEK